jgi:hypothetical protein
MTMLLKSDFRPGNWIRSISADWLNTVAKRLNNITMQNGEVDITEDEIILYPGVYGGDSDTDISDFNISNVDLTGTNPVVSIRGGNWNFHSQAHIVIATADFTITGTSPSYIYLEVDEDGAVGEIKQSGTWQETTLADPEADPPTTAIYRKVIWTLSEPTTGNLSVDGDHRPNPDVGGGSTGLSIHGTPGIFKSIILREYDADGDLVAIGDESDPLTTGHTLRLTYDYIRAVDGAT